MCKKLTTQEFIQKAKLIHNKRYDYSKVEYVNSQTKVCIICPKHGEFWQSPNHHLSKYGCSKCIGLNKTTKTWIIEVKLVHGDKYDYSKSNYVNAHNKVCIICPEHGEFYQSPTNHLQNHGCPKCKSKKLSELFTYSFNVFEEKCNKIHNNEYEYFSETYKNYNSKIKIKHKKCQKIFFQKASSHINHGCPFCHKNNFSYGELLIEQWLIKTNILYVSQKTFKNCRGKKRPLPFDFYLPDYNTCIEFDGKHHFGKGKFAKESVKSNDKTKDEYCKQNNIHLIRIPYFERQNFEKLLIHLI